MKTLVATALLAYATADETSLMQDLVTRSSSRKLEAKSGRHDTASKLLDNAVAMIKNGVTPDVVQFVDATTAENEEVLQIILREHMTERDYVKDVCNRFDTAKAALEDSKTEILTLSAGLDASRADHQNCRADESLRCGNSRRCEAQLRTRWEYVVETESEMKKKHDDIERGWCVDPDTTTKRTDVWNGFQDEIHWLSRPFDSSFWGENLPTQSSSPYPILDIPEDVVTFRTSSVTHFNAYMTQKKVVWGAWESYNAKAAECADLESYWEDKLDVCDLAQTTHRTNACAHAAKVKDARTTIGETWRAITTELDLQMDNILAKAENRKNEWETITIVQCLLNHVHSAVITSIETGAPCPTLTSDPDGVAAKIEDCHQVTRGCDAIEKTDAELRAMSGADRTSTHLCIEPCEEPTPPVLPEVVEPPCTPAYIAKETSRFSEDIRLTYTDSLNSNYKVEGQDGPTYGPYADEQLTQQVFGLLPWASHQWPGCAPPLACIDCSEETFAEVPPVKTTCLDGTETCHTAYNCQLHEEFLSAGQSSVDTFKCHDGTCIEQKGRCNDHPDCADESDELGCTDAGDEYVSKSFACPVDFHPDVHFRCGGSDGIQCIEKVGLCNGHINCDDDSDEAECSASELELTLETTSGRGAEVISAPEVLATVFSDRSYTFDSLGDMQGKTFIKYNNDDKMIDDVHVMTKIRASAPVRVFIATTTHRPQWVTDQEWSESQHSGPSFSGVKMTRHKDWELEKDLHKSSWSDAHHGRLATVHWEDGGYAKETFSTHKVYYKDFPAGTISISGNANSAYTEVGSHSLTANNVGSSHYDGSLSDKLDAQVHGSFLIFLERHISEQGQVCSSNAPTITLAQDVSPSASGGGDNVASQSAGAIPFGSGSLSGYCHNAAGGTGVGFGGGGIHCWDNINDGLTGNSHSWIPDKSEAKHFVGIVFDGSQTVSSFSLGRDQTGHYSDRTGGTYELQYTSADTGAEPHTITDWCSAGTFYRNTHLRMAFQLSEPIQATAVRMVVSHRDACIDELEVYRHTAA